MTKKWVPQPSLWSRPCPREMNWNAIYKKIVLQNFVLCITIRYHSFFAPHTFRFFIKLTYVKLNKQLFQLQINLNIYFNPQNLNYKQYDKLQLCQHQESVQVSIYIKYSLSNKKIKCYC